MNLLPSPDAAHLNWPEAVLLVGILAFALAALVAILWRT